MSQDQQTRARLRDLQHQVDDLKAEERAAFNAPSGVGGFRAFIRRAALEQDIEDIAKRAGLEV